VSRRLRDGGGTECIVHIDLADIGSDTSQVDRFSTMFIWLHPWAAHAYKKDVIWVAQLVVRNTSNV